MTISGIEIPENNDEVDPSYSLGFLLRRGVPTGVLASIIESHGIETYDRYGRFGKTDKDGEAVALALLAAMNTWEFSEPRFMADPRSPLELEEGDYSDFDKFGWNDIQAISDVGDALPDAAPCSASPEHEDLSPRSKRAYLAVIAALCEEAKVTPDARGLPQKLANHTQRLEVTRGAETIRNILKEVKEFIR
jgi:hypothetical protein